MQEDTTRERSCQKLDQKYWASFTTEAALKGNKLFYFGFSFEKQRAAL